MLTSVHYLARLRAEALWLKESHAVISITEPHGSLAKLRGSPYQILRTAFFDVDGHDERGFPPISSSQAEMVVSTIEGWHRSSKEINVIVHCEAGLSRSAAVARFIAERYRVVLIGGTAEFANLTVVRALQRAAGGVTRGDEEGEGR